MVEVKGHDQVKSHDTVKEIIKKWKLGVQFDEEGYEDLGFSIQLDAINEAVKLGPEDRQKIADKLFPIKKHGN